MTSRVYATVVARFDETYFPFRTFNQRVYGQDYTPSILRQPGDQKTV